MLIAIPVWDTVENKRTQLTKLVVEQLLKTISAHDRVIVSDNGSCEETIEFIENLNDDRLTLLRNGRNLGIADGANAAWEMARDDEIVCKMDNDCFILTPGWTSIVSFVLSKSPDIGILGMKRKDLLEHPQAQEPYRSKLSFCNHEPGERWIVVEDASHIMGTCYCFNPALRKKFGFLNQPKTIYGFDDSLASVRARVLGFRTCFLPQIEIDHLDVSGTKKTDEYTKWKNNEALGGMEEYNNMVNGYISGRLNPYHDWKER